MLRLIDVAKKNQPSKKRPTLESDFGAAVRARRHGLGLTQEELAWRADMHRTYIADIERGGRNLTLRSIAALAEALQIPIAALVPMMEGGADAASNLVEILLIEDSREDAELAVRSLSRAKVSNPIRVVHDGAEALDFLLGTGAYANETPALPGLILLDLQLPTISGLEVLRRIKMEKRTKEIPVVVLTSSLRDHNIIECGRLGAENYIVKPVNFGSLGTEAARMNFRWTLQRPDKASGGIA